MPISRTFTLLLLAGLAGLAFGQSVSVMDSPAPEGSGQPHLDRGPDGVVRLSWVARRGPLARMQYSVLGAGEWSAPRLIAEGADWFVNWADVPSLVAGRDGKLAAHWLQRLGEGTYSYGVRVRTSSDDGRTWGEPFWLHDDLSPSEHGFCSITPSARPGDGMDFDAAWLDGRAMARTDEMSLRARSFAVDGKRSDERLIDPRVCECCPTDLMVGPKGAPVVVYRDRTADDTRDISWSVARPLRWTPPAAVHDDGWKRPG